LKSLAPIDSLSATTIILDEIARVVLNTLKEFGPLYGFEVEEIPALESSGRFCEFHKDSKGLEEGDVATANRIFRVRIIGSIGIRS
jgi:FAD synthase